MATIGQAYTGPAASHQYFGGDFSYSRMSWIKPNFLWMMYRSGWGTKAGQEVILAIRLKRSFFDQILEQAVISSFTDNTYFEDKDAWKKAVKTSDVRLQWDPDHNPSGLKQERKAVQLGLRNDVLKEYGRDAIVDINDISDYVAEQRVFANGDYQDLMVPEERVYIPSSERASQNIDLTINTNR